MGSVLAFLLSMLTLCALVTLGFAVWAERVPDHWNPLTPLDVAAPVTPLTSFKLSRAASDPAMCKATLFETGAAVETRPDHEYSDVCHIRSNTQVAGLSHARLDPMNTRCDMALRLYMWERHSLQPAAETHLGSRVAQITHFDSYACRALRTERGPANVMSAHATARAIDIRGVVLDSGRTVPLLGNWTGDAATEAFWRDVRDGACRWFRTVLSPDYNRLHQDHFHFAEGRWSACR